jgi:hypothetical protein
MSRDDEVKNVRLFDIRAIERNIRKGLITRKDYDKHLKSLPDVTDKIAPRDAPGSAAPAAAARPYEHVPAPIIIHPADPADEDLSADLDDEDDDDEDEDEDEELDGDDIEDTSNGTSEKPPQT